MKGRVLVLIIICNFCAAGANAALVNRDLLGGLGDFEWSANFSWESYYTGSAYDWDLQTGEWYQAGDHKWGYNNSKPDDAVAPGWMRSSSATVNPGENIVYRIAAGEGKNGSGCQYFALKDLSLTNGQYASTGLTVAFKVSSSKSDIHAGDHVKFVLDQIKMSDYTGLPSQTYLAYTISLSWTNGYEKKNLQPSSTPLPSPSNEVEATIDATTGYVVATVGILAADGNLGSHQPGIYVDGAHLYIRRAGSSNYEKEEVPVAQAKSIKTMLSYFDPYINDVYQTARNYDRVMLKCEEWYPWALRLKYYNPSIKVYLYETTDITDMRISENRDRVYSNCPFGFWDVLQNHSEWLYAYDQYPYSLPDPRDEEWKQVSYYFALDLPYHYFDRLDNQDLQQEWYSSASDKAHKYRLDGVFMDGPPSISVTGDSQKGVNQMFLHSVTPKLRGSSLEVIQNCCNLHLDNMDELGDAGRIYFDPWWNTGGVYTEPDYSNNTPINTANGFYQEWAFFRPDLSDHNTYSTTTWLRTLKDMDTVAKWNLATDEKALPENQKKWMHILVLGNDNTDDPAYGLDGWIGFGISSYLLGQHEWTTFGCGMSESHQTDMDFDITANLASPAGPHAPYGGDQLLRYRWYNGSNTAVGGLVIVNGDTDNNKQFQPQADLYDMSGRYIPATNTVTLTPHTGRILVNQTNYKYTSTVNGPREGEVVFSGTYWIKGNVRKNRAGLPFPTAVQIRVDNDKWKKALVDREGNWTYQWLHRSPGRHMIYTRTYVNARDMEPDRIARQVFCTNDSRFKPLSTIVDALMQPDGTLVWLQSKRVTAASQELPGMMYIQDVGVSGSIRGIKILKPATDPKITETGETVDIVGVIATIGGERCIADAMVTSNDTLKIDLPVMTMPNMAVGGADWNYNPATGAGQRGITGASGANNIGMLIRTYGTVTSIDSSTFYLSDGSNANLKVIVPPGVNVPVNRGWVTVTGICSCEQSGSALTRLIRVRTQGDIQALNSGQ